MHSINLQIDDSIYAKFKSLLESMPTNKFRIVSDEAIRTPSFFVSSEDEVRERVQEAEQEDDFAPHDTFWDEIDNHNRQSA